MKSLTLLVVGGHQLPLSLSEMAAMHDIAFLHANDCRQACSPAFLSKADGVVVCQSSEDDECRSGRLFAGDLDLLADALRAHRLTGILLCQEDCRLPSADLDTFVTAPSDISVDELWGRVSTIRQYRPLLRQMDQQVAVMQQLGKKLNKQFVEVDQELRLASRLQRDFLPRVFPEVGDIRFGTIYRPASWVSGDIYDVSRLDEGHVAFYLADAVGHGIAAGLLTMFIKQAVVAKQVEGDAYRLVPPEEVLVNLNEALARQELPNCQFVTACYAHVDTRTGLITFSRGGHPHPIHVSADGSCSEVRTIGGLLGVFAGESYPSTTIQLKPGDKLIMYSDGLEDAIIAGRDRKQGTVTFTPGFLEMARCPIEECMQSLVSSIEQTEGSLAPPDDITVVGAERLMR